MGNHVQCWSIARPFQTHLTILNLLRCSQELAGALVCPRLLFTAADLLWESRGTWDVSWREVGKQNLGCNLSPFPLLHRPTLLLTEARRREWLALETWLRSGRTRKRRTILSSTSSQSRQRTGLTCFGHQLSLPCSYGWQCWTCLSRLFRSSRNHRKRLVNKMATSMFLCLCLLFICSRYKGQMFSHVIMYSSCIINIISGHCSGMYPINTN